ncbi:tripartite motif-containing protein 29-like [Sinocyclocheilus grahami]|uniref:tripartite motif-containing protein 29-like n=1 Tax=Sinocyclocheilus grahami TaxID=75366 RepID=UPI0007ACB8BD|nr:PREDICTED: tripartite motif-containing protein 29-like [Sinocyclocheilus grahami]XP_016144287.1 PREDICTED: tripartite motif-containing protein 29-like [Sinocyclocheilus grahami]
MAELVFDTQNPLNCPICLNLLKNPLTTSCGHSFCMDCIKGCWDQDASLRRAYSCPTCRTTFNQRPALSRSTVLAEIVEGMKREVPAGPRDVKCDVCKIRKLKAIKSCLVCLASYCQTHIRPHYESEAFKKHKLVNASSNLQQQICSQHHKALEIYCYNDRKCICVVCMGDQHSGHKTVSAAAEMAKKQEELKIKKRDFTQKITDIGKKVQAFRKAVDSHKRSAQAAVEHSDRIFNELIRSIQKRRGEVRELIRAQEKKEMVQINEHIQKLEQELSNLQNENDKLGPLLHTEDNIHFFQNYSSQSGVYLCTTSPRDVNDLLTFENVDKSVSELNSQLVKLCEEHMGKISKKVADVHIFKTTRLQYIASPVASASDHSSDDDCMY